MMLWASYVIVQRPSVRQISSNDVVGPYWRDQSTRRADRRRRRRQCQSLSVVTAQSCRWRQLYWGRSRVWSTGMSQDTHL